MLMPKLSHITATDITVILMPTVTAIITARDLLMPKLSPITAMVITVILMPIVMDTIMERGPLMLSLLPQLNLKPQLSLKPQLMLSPPQPQSLVMVTVILMPIITVTTTAKGLLMLSLITAMDTTAILMLTVTDITMERDLLMPKLSPITVMVIMAILMPTVTDIITARDPLMLSLPIPTLTCLVAILTVISATTAIIIKLLD